MNKKLIRLTESDLHRIVKESVNRILNEVDGYEKTMLKANPNFDKSTIRGKIGRLFNPKKAQQFDRIHNNAEETFNNAKKDYWRNRNENLPSASDPYARPSQEDLERGYRDYNIMNKYKVGRKGLRDKYWQY